MLIFMGIIVSVFGILQIILFFKLWGMTNDIKKIKNKYVGGNFPETDNSQKINNPPTFLMGDIVIHQETKEQYVVNMKIGNNSFDCSTIDGENHFVFSGYDLLKIEND